MCLLTITLYCVYILPVTLSKEGQTMRFIQALFVATLLISTQASAQSAEATVKAPSWWDPDKLAAQLVEAMSCPIPGEYDDRYTVRDKPLCRPNGQIMAVVGGQWFNNGLPARMRDAGIPYEQIRNSLSDPETLRWILANTTEVFALVRPYVEESVDERPFGKRIAPGFLLRRATAAGDDAETQQSIIDLLFEIYQSFSPPTGALADGVKLPDMFSD